MDLDAVLRCSSCSQLHVALISNLANWHSVREMRTVPAFLRTLCTALFIDSFDGLRRNACDQIQLDFSL